MSAATLPIELWRIILRHATHVPFALDTDWRYNPDDCLWAGWPSPDDDSDFNEELLDSDATKRTAVLVCRAWRDIGIEFLYETIRIPYEASKIILLVETMEQSASGSYRGHGWWTKRIEWIGRSFSESLDHIISFLALCHNVQIFALLGTEVPSSIQPTLAAILQSRFSHSLKRMEVLIEYPDRRHSSNYAETLPDASLTSLSISLRTPVHDFPFHPRFETISTLTLYIPGRLISLPTKWYLPNLKNLALHYFDEDDIPALTSFTVRHHHTIVHLTIRPANSECNFTPLISGMPRIHSLTFKHTDLEYLETIRGGPEKALQIPSVTQLGILPQDSTKDYIPLVGDAMEHVLEAGHFLGLRIVRLLHRVRLEDMSDWEKLGVLLRRRGIILEDFAGRSMVGPMNGAQ